MTDIYHQNFPEIISGSGLARIRGKRGPVTEDIPKDGAGKIKMDRREWPAVSLDNMPLKADTRIEVVSTREDGTLVVKRANPGG